MAEATRLLQSTDRILKSFPEVESVLGKAGRASTATDPAPLSMFETLVVLKPREQWPSRPGLGRMTTEQLIAAMDQALKLPGLTNSWTMPIRGRMDMLATGMRVHARPEDHRPHDGRYSKARGESGGGVESRYRDRDPFSLSEPAMATISTSIGIARNWDARESAWKRPMWPYSMQSAARL